MIFFYFFFQVIDIVINLPLLFTNTGTNLFCIRKFSCILS